MMIDDVYLTQEGYDKIAAELEDMIKRQRIELAERLRAAIQQGDLSENADYHKAKEDQAFLEGKILEYQDKISRAKIIVKKGKSGIVEIGSIVTIKEEDYPEEQYHVVGAAEANPREGKISNESPIGRAVLGCKEGDEVVAETPGGEMKLKIIKVE
jgi:transcription elongation factor GreA